MPTLYLVATPIGNLEDITRRALRVLGEVGLIAAEDTRRTRKLLSHYDLHTPLTSYHQVNKEKKLSYLLRVLREKDVALVSDAGMPGLSDPGSELVAACAQGGIPVVAIPGPSAVPTAVALSGLPAGSFLFLGFLPRRAGERRRLLEGVASLPYTLVLLEAPHRLRKSLQALGETLGERRVAVARELTKLHEEVFRGTLSGALDYFQNPLGEFTLVIEGAAPRGMGEEEVLKELRRLKGVGLRAKEVLARLSPLTPLPRRELYRLWLELS